MPDSNLPSKEETLKAVQTLFMFDGTRNMSVVLGSQDEDGDMYLFSDGVFHHEDKKTLDPAQQFTDWFYERYTNE